MNFPFIAYCQNCDGNGQILFWKCGECQKIIGVCDECDSGWMDLEAVHKDNTVAADFEIGEKCPFCGNDSLLGKFLNEKEISQFPACVSICCSPLNEPDEREDKIQSD